MRLVYQSLLTAAAAANLAWPAMAANFDFSTGVPDGAVATLSATATSQHRDTETADDFVLPTATRLSGGSFTGLLPSDLRLSAVKAISIQFYHIFPANPTVPPSGHVVTRLNSPDDVDFLSRDSAAGELSFTATLLNPQFKARNSVVDGIAFAPDQFTGGDGAVVGQEVAVGFTLAGGVTLDAGHYFFVPQVTLDDGTFLWLSAAKPIAVPGKPDLQTWIRNSDLDPDWSRIGTDITRQGPFNASFSLAGSTVPEPASWALLVAGFGVVGAVARRRGPATVAA